MLRAAGTNCDRESVYAVELAGGTAERVHVNRLCEKPDLLGGFGVLIVPGGFSYGDDVMAGRIFGNQLRVPGDLSIPDETDALRVPGVPLPGEGAGSSDECLEFSPALQTAQEGQQQSED